MPAPSPSQQQAMSTKVVTKDKRIGLLRWTVEQNRLGSVVLLLMESQGPPGQKLFLAEPAPEIGVSMVDIGVLFEASPGLVRLVTVRAWEVFSWCVLCHEVCPLVLLRNLQMALLAPEQACSGLGEGILKALGPVPPVLLWCLLPWLILLLLIRTLGPVHLLIKNLLQHTGGVSKKLCN